MASTYLDLRAITNLSGRKIRVRTDKSVIAYPSVWPLARRTILVGICFPSIPWPMTGASPDRARSGLYSEPLDAGYEAGSYPEPVGGLGCSTSFRVR
jgi:hypothetical protein